MSTDGPIMIEETNLSHAWGRIFLEAMNRPKANPAPFMLTLTGFQGGLPQRDMVIESPLDEFLVSSGKHAIGVTSMLIFPFRQWEQQGRPERAMFFNWYSRFVRRLKARNSHNRNGTYFERMIALEGVHKSSVTAVNQLDRAIAIWQRCQSKGGRPPQSVLRVACLDPAKDLHRWRRPAFPCLQQVNFNYDDAGGLAVSAYYPVQYIVDRAYGNYLGLCHLGYFMARELGLQLVRFNCFIGRAELGQVNKAELEALRKLVSGMIPGVAKPSGETE